MFLVWCSSNDVKSFNTCSDHMCYHDDTFIHLNWSSLVSAVNYSTALMRQVQLYKITFNFTHEKNLIVISTFNRLVNESPFRLNCFFFCILKSFYLKLLLGLSPPQFPHFVYLRPHDISRYWLTLFVVCFFECHLLSIFFPISKIFLITEFQQNF